MHTINHTVSQATQQACEAARRAQAQAKTTYTAPVRPAAPPRPAPAYRAHSPKSGRCPIRPLSILLLVFGFLILIPTALFLLTSLIALALSFEPTAIGVAACSCCRWEPASL